MRDPGGGATHPWRELGPGIRVRQSAAFSMNSTVLSSPEHTVIVDPGVLPSELDDLAEAVRRVETNAVTLLLTHAHWDHVLGRAWWPRASVLAHDRFAAAVRAHAGHILEKARARARLHGESWERDFTPYRPDQAVSGLHFAKLGPWRLVLRDAPGHDDSQLTIHLPEQRLLIAADMLSDHEVPILDRPCAVYRHTLEELLPLALHGAIETLIPGHGTVARGRVEVVARLTRDIGYLDRLAAAAHEAVRDGSPVEVLEERLGTMDDRLRAIDETVREAHRDNIALEYRAAALDAAPGS